MASEQLSGKFPHRVTELLTPYITQTTPLVREAKSVLPVNNFPVREIIEREFSHALVRQRGSNFPGNEKARNELMNNMTGKLREYVDKFVEFAAENELAEDRLREEQLRAVIGLCQTVAFANRKPAELA
jgi:hypothetical protein